MEKIGTLFDRRIEIVKRDMSITMDNVSYTPRIKDTKPLIEPDKLKFGRNSMYKVIDILEDGKLKLDTGVIVKFKGVRITSLESILSYLRKYVLKKKVYLKFDKGFVAKENIVEANELNKSV